MINNDVKIAVSQANEIINEYPKLFKEKWLNEMRKKIGLKKIEKNDETLINNLLTIMSKNHLDYTTTFRNLISKKIIKKDLDNEFKNWTHEWNKRLEKEDTSFDIISKEMNKYNPLYIPRNHLVEKVISEAVEKNNFQALNHFLDLITNPFSKKNDDNFYTDTPKPDERVYQTFCGT